MMVESRQARYRHRLQSTVYLYGCIHISLHEMATASAEVPLNGVKGCGRFLNTAPHSCHMTVGSLECVSDDSRPRAFFAPLTIWTSGLGPSSDSSFIGPGRPPHPPYWGYKDPLFALLAKSQRRRRLEVISQLFILLVHPPLYLMLSSESVTRQLPLCNQMFRRHKDAPRIFSADGNHILLEMKRENAHSWFSHCGTSGPSALIQCDRCPRALPKPVC